MSMNSLAAPGMVRGNTLPSISAMDSPRTARTVADVAVEPRVARASATPREPSIRGDASHAKHGKRDKHESKPLDVTVCIMGNHPKLLDQALRAVVQTSAFRACGRNLRERADAMGGVEGGRREMAIENAKRDVDELLDELAPVYAGYLSTALLTRHKKCVRALLHFHVVHEAAPGAGGSANGIDESKHSPALGMPGVASSIVTVCPTTVRVCSCEGQLLQEPRTCRCFMQHKNVPEVDEFRSDSSWVRDDSMLTARCVGHFAAAVAWGDIDVFRWLLQARRGARLVKVGADGARATLDATRSMMDVVSRQRQHGQGSAQREDLAYLNLLMYICAQPHEMLNFAAATLRYVDIGCDRAGLERYPIHIAAERGHSGIVKLLVQRGARLHRKDAHGNTPLHAALKHGQMNSTRALIEAGGDVNRRNEHGQTPLHLLYESQDRVARHLTAAAFGMVSQVARVPSILRPSVERGSARAARHAEAVVAIGSEAAESASPPPQQGGAGGSDALRASTHAPHESKESNGSSAGLVAKPSVQSMMGTRSGLAPAASKSAIVDFERRLASTENVAIRNNAQLDALDLAERPAFSHKSQMRWYSENVLDLFSAISNNLKAGFVSEMFDDPRAQLAVQTKWAAKVRQGLCFDLCMWVLFMVLVLVTAVMATGRDAHYTRSFQVGFEEAILFDEYGDHHSGFWDMRNEGELWEWIEEVLTPNVYRHPGYYRDGANSATHQAHTTGTIMSFNHLVGRPRIRTIRNMPEDCVGLRDSLAAFNRSKCFNLVGRSMIDQRPFTTGAYEWKYRHPDVPPFQGIVENYPGSGHWHLMPRFESDWTPMLNAMRDNQFVDMQTRLVIVEMTVYNPSHHLFLVARMGVEFASTGTVHPIAKVDTLRLVNYLTVNDYVRAVLEILVACLMVRFAFQEIKQMTYPWPEEQQKLFVPTLKFPVPVHLEPFLDKVFPVPMKDDTGDGNADFIPNRTCCSCCRCCCPGWRRRRHKIHPSQASARFGDEPVAPAKSQASKQDVHAAGDDSHVGHAVQATKEIVHMATGQVKRACQCGCLKGFDIRTYDTNITIPPYFTNAFWIVDVSMVLLFLALAVVQVLTSYEANDVNWHHVDGFVNTYALAELVRFRIYLLAVTLFLVIIKSLDYLRVNRSLSTFILVIRGMLAKITDFFIILAVCLIAFAALEYVAFGHHFDDASTFTLSVIRGFAGALGDVDMLRNFHMARYMAPLFSIAFAVFILILLFNLLIAVMSEAYEDIKERAASAWCFTQFQMIAQVESRENHQKKEGDVGRFCRNFLRCASGTVVVVAVVMVTGLLLFWVDDNDVA